MIFVYCFLAALMVVSVALFLVLRIMSPNKSSLSAKLVASFIFVVMGILSLCTPGYTVVKAMFVLGLVCGLIGDVVLELKVNYSENVGTYLNIGTMFFGFGHIAYFFGIVVYVTAVVVIGFWWMTLAALIFSLLVAWLIVGNSKALKLDMTGFKVQSYFYTAMLLFVTIISVCLALAEPLAAIIGVGFALFFASDLVLSFQYFGGKPLSKPLTIVNHCLYYAAQLLIATFIFFI